MNPYVKSSHPLFILNLNSHLQLITFDLDKVIGAGKKILALTGG